MRRLRGLIVPCSLLLLLAVSVITGGNEMPEFGAQHPIRDLPKPMRLDWQTDDDAPTLRTGKSQRQTLMDIALQQSVREGLDAMTELYGKIQPEMLRNGQLLQDNHPAALLARFNAPIEDTERREMAAFATLSASKAFRKNYKHLNELARQSHAPKVSLKRTALEGLCSPRDAPLCMPASERYRTHDGTCNNKRRPRWGASQMPFNRFLPPEYGDGVDSVRTSADGNPLSSSRFVSLLVHGAREGDAPLTLMIAQWGQLLDHDLTSTAQPRSINGSIPSCCGGKDFHPSCFPIKVPLDDPWLAPLKVRCLEFLRSAPAQRRDCVLSWREQTNQATSYIDASPIYANSAKASDSARIFRNGLLIYGRGNQAEDVCLRGAIATHCIRSGDGRSGEQPGLLAMHHVWVGEHNRIAMELSEINPHWADEKLYQESRRIVGAIFQHITYREFLPIVLGREVCKLFDLELLNSGYYEGYDPKVNPTVANSFAAAAFRFGHSLVQNTYVRCDRHHNIINNNVSLHEEFQRGDIGSAGSLHRLLRGLATQRALKRDEFITPELTNHLFQTPGFPFGLDLAAINIQRGRDHGIAPYTAWRVPCGLSPVQSWDDFAKVVGPESAKRIGHAYRSVHDIDLFVGGIAERPVVGGLVGPTFACIIAQQFSNSRKGDRFWYENGGFESSFTPAQLHAIRHVSLAQVICRAVGGGTLQPHIFIPSDFPENERIPCGVGPLEPIDLSAWLEQDPFVVPSAHPPIFSPRLPEQVFQIMSPNINTNSLLISKEEKAGFSNREPLLPNVNPIKKPHTSDVTQIHDKLDLKRKTQLTTLRTTRGPINKVHNLLDKAPKITLNIKNINIKRNTQTKTPTLHLKSRLTTKRTVVINNVPIELRSVDSTKSNATEEKKKIDSQNVELRHQITQTGDIAASANNTKHISTDADIDPMKRENTQIEHKRIQRHNKDAPLLKTIKLTTSNKTLTKIFDTEYLLHLQKLSADAIPVYTTASTTDSPRLSKSTTKRSIEVRSEYQNRPLYTRPQKVVVSGPNADQYEIEINIRQTNKGSTVPITPNYNEYTMSYNQNGGYAPHYYDRYASPTSGPYGYNQPPPTGLSTNVPRVQRTKPPTIIYLNELDDRRTTTHAPGLFQNFLTFATNGFSNNRRPTSTPISTANKERPQNEPIVVNSPSSYVPRPQAQYPVSSSVQISSLPNSGFLHASSAVSTGNFGSISGITSSNGADSTFSFNIRHRPDTNYVDAPYARPDKTQISSPHYSKPEADNNGYGFQSQRKPIFPSDGSPSLTNNLYHSPESVHGQSPFSGSHQNWQPSSSYSRSPELKETHNTDKHIYTAHKLDISDYDYLSRTLINLTENANVSSDDDSNEFEEDTDHYTDYQQYDDFDNSSENDVKKFDRDGYLRPEFSTNNMDREDSKTNQTISNDTYLDDNYVLPMLTSSTASTTTVTHKKSEPLVILNLDATTTYANLTNCNDTVGKHMPNDIVAEDEEQNIERNDTDYAIDFDATDAILKANKLSAVADVAFAPLKVLTKPDRPDNWIIYDTPKAEKPPLPQTPALEMDSSHTMEVPTPMKSLNSKWTNKNLQLKVSHPTNSGNTSETAKMYKNAD